jgi:hypothetical protein
MQTKFTQFITITSCFLLILFLPVFAPKVSAQGLAQQPTVAIPTVTGTPPSAIIRVNTDNEQINVRSGPNTNYDQIGILVAGQEIPALGRTPSGDWVQIAYPGVDGGVAWVYASLVTLIIGGELPIVEPPPPPKPQITPTIDPTLAAEFVVEDIPTRLPTFTPPPPLFIPTYENPLTSGSSPVNIPMGLPIIVLGVFGVLGSLFSFIRRR